MLVLNVRMPKGNTVAFILDDDARYDPGLVLNIEVRACRGIGCGTPFVVLPGGTKDFHSDECRRTFHNKER